MGCCCGGDAKWKREVINDHKFDYVDVDEFRDESFFSKFKYMFVFIFTIKSVLIYVLDIYTAVMLIAFNSWTSSVHSQISFKYTRWIFTASILASYVLVFFEFKKARAIIRSRDISFAFTSIIANRYYTLRSYPHYCFFNQIHSQKRFKDDVAFYVFFALKGWKRFLFAEAPRQVVNGYTLVRLFMKGFYDFHNLYIPENMLANISLITMGVPFVLFVISAILTFIAGLLYIPLVCQIRGNLKEYCCHKIDKRVAELLRIRSQKRVLRDQMLNGTLQPTKPTIAGIDEIIMTESIGSAGGATIVEVEKQNISSTYSAPVESKSAGARARRLSQSFLLSDVANASDQRSYTIAVNREYRAVQQQQSRLANQKPTLPNINQLFSETSEGTGAVIDASHRTYISLDSRSASGSDNYSDHSSNPSEHPTSSTSHSHETSDYRRNARPSSPLNESSGYAAYDLDELPNRYQDKANRPSRTHRPVATMPNLSDSVPKVAHKGAVNF
ncbi:Potassium transporter [Basidiobolus ranarum]|uniref:Potassium transporter n=1 Tax=Basidiobolus ranarum TaxID=34480 RepID=A0ABR2W3Z2_9FUNG